MNLKLYKQIEKELIKIEKAMGHLEDIGVIKCPIEGCGDISCASAVVYNAISDCKLKIWLLMDGKIKKGR